MERLMLARQSLSRSLLAWQSPSTLKSGKFGNTKLVQKQKIHQISIMVSVVTFLPNVQLTNKSISITQSKSVADDVKYKACSASIHYVFNKDVLSVLNTY